MKLDPKVYTVLPTGDYVAEIQTVEEDTGGQFGPQLKVVFDLGEVEDVDGNAEPRTLSAWCSQTLSPKSKLWGWCQAAGLDPAEGIDTDELLGASVVLTVTIKAKDDGTEFNKIEAVRAPRRQTARKVVKREPAEAEAEAVPF